MHTIIRINTVIRRSGRSKTSIYEGVRERTFPAPIPIGARAVGWIEEEVNDWIEERISEARSGKPKLSELLSKEISK